MQWQVKCNSFEGPMDLLLYLIRINEIDIFDIPIMPLINKYLDFIDEIKGIELPRIGEFFQMAATMVFIKSKLLLPSDNTALKEDFDEVEAFKADLTHKLLEFQALKLAANNLEAMPQLDRDVFAAGYLEQLTRENQILTADYDYSLNLLTQVYCEVLSNFEKNQRVHRVEMQILTIEEKQDMIMLQLSGQKTLTFRSLIEACESKFEIVVTFLALLELVKYQQVKISQHEGFSEIYVTLRERTTA